MVADKKRIPQPFEEVAWNLLMKGQGKWSDLEPMLQRKWKRQVKGFLAAWFESDFREQLFNKKFIKTALAVLKLSTKRGLSNEDILRHVIVSFVTDVIDPEIVDKKKIIIP